MPPPTAAPRPPRAAACLAAALALGLAHCGASEGTSIPSYAAGLGDLGGAPKVVGGGTTGGDPNATTAPLPSAPQAFAQAPGMAVAVAGSDLCLTFPAAAGAATLQACDGLGGQRFTLSATGAVRGVGNNLCLDLTGSSSADGSALVAAPCANTDSQRWTYTLGQLFVAASASQCVDASGSASVGAALQVRDCTSPHAPGLKLVLGHEGVLVGVAPGGTMAGACLQVALTGGQAADGAAVRLATCNKADPAQLWTLEGSGQLRGPNNKCLDVAGGAVAEGATAVVAACAGTATQAWSWVGLDATLHINVGPSYGLNFAQQGFINVTYPARVSQTPAHWVLSK